nr:transmembrane protease serine 11G-like [Biomphalaria glabrata]
MGMLMQTRDKSQGTKSGNRLFGYQTLMWSMRPSRQKDFDTQEEVESNGPCFGDNGGPLMCGPNNQNLELVGIGSYVEPTCMPSAFPSVYVHLPAYRKWLSDKL